MKIKWKEKKRTVAKGPWIVLTKMGPFVWPKVGAIVDLPDEAGFEVLEKYGSVAERVEEEEPKKTAAKTMEKRSRVPRNKRMKNYEDK